jgi:Dolichyl-phosphate-mannose-protein mannosyltransferase
MSVDARSGPLIPLLEHRVTLWFVGLLSALFFLTTDVPWQLDDYDQAKQAFTSLEMVQEGHWFYQHTPHERVATKPPLVGWSSAAAFAVTRSWEVAWRLPSILAAFTLFYLLLRTATDAYGKLAGLLAASAFSLNLLTPRLASLVRTDMPLAFLIFVMGLMIWRKVRGNEPWESRDRWTFFVLLTGTMLIKGPTVYAFLLPGIVLIQWRRRRGRDRYNAWCGWWPWIVALLIFLVWVTGGIVFERGFFDQVVMREFLGRFGETVHRPQPLLFYVPHLLHKFFPWSVLMIGLAAVELRSRRWRMRGVFREMSPETFWLVSWIFGGLIVMSIIPSKRVDRIFPIIPPLCLLLAAQVANALRKYQPSSHGSASRPSIDSSTAATSSPTSRPSIDSGTPATSASTSRPSIDSGAGATSGEMVSAGAAHGAVATGGQNAQGAMYRWSALALAVAMLFTGGYWALKVISGHREHRGALAGFCREVRLTIAAHHWRYAVLNSPDEGLLPYLRKTHFIRPEEAITEWNRGNLDALVVSAREAPVLMRELHDAAFSGLRSEVRKDAPARTYVVITR